MTVKTAPERDRPRNIKNKLVHLIHDVVPSHSCFRHRWINELGHSSATRRLHQHDDGRPWKLGISNCALGGDIGVRQNEESQRGPTIWLIVSACLSVAGGPSCASRQNRTR